MDFISDFFDFNNDGEVDAVEGYMAYNILEESMEDDDEDDDYYDDDDDDDDDF